MSTNRIIFFVILLGVIVYGVIVLTLGIFEGILPAGGVEQFYLEYTSVAVTLLFVFLAVRLVRRNIILRMALLEAASFLNITCYGIFPEATSFLYLLIVCLISFAFVFPVKE